MSSRSVRSSKSVRSSESAGVKDACQFTVTADICNLQVESSRKSNC